MAIKWKNSYTVFVATLLLVVGSMLYFSNSGNNIPRRVTDYRVENELGPKLMLNYLKKFDEKSLTTEMVSSDLVESYRYEYGGLDSQVQDIHNQYKPLIKTAKDNKEEKLIKSLTEERDAKVLDIVANHTSNQVVQEKIVKRDAKKITDKSEALIKELEKSSLDYVNDNYVYYFKGDDGFVLTNLTVKPSSQKDTDIKAAIAKENVQSVKQKTIWTSWSDELMEIDLVWNLDGVGGLSAEGYTAIKKGSYVAKENQRVASEKKRQEVLMTIGLALCLVGGILALRFLLAPIYFSEQANAIQRLPLDVRLFGLAAIGILVFIIKMSEPKFRILSWRSLFFLIFAYLGTLIGLCLIKNLWLAIKKTEGYPDFPTQAKGSVFNRVTKEIRRLLNTIPTTLKILAVLGYFLVIGIVAMMMMYGSGSIEMGLFIFLPLVLVGFVPLIIREYRLASLLKQPQAILVANQEEALPSELLEDVAENLAHINQIISTTHDKRQQSETLKTELLTNVSHDLRTPLTSIITYGDLLTKPDLKAEDREEYTAIINRKAMRMKNLIDDLFAVTKMNNGEITLNKKLINLGQLLQQSIAEYGEELAEKELKLIYTQPDESQMIEIDGERMWRVFDNIIGNVVKYAMPSTRVYLKLEEVGNELKIELKNISLHELNEDASNLVERFTRGDEARNTEGSGLGLAIANSIVTLHDGRFEITVDGDMFKIQIYLPRRTII